MRFSEYLVEGMSTFLDDNPEALAAYTAYHRLSADPILWRKIKARERFLTNQWLDLAYARKEWRKEDEVRKVCETALNMDTAGALLLDMD